MNIITKNVPNNYIIKVQWLSGLSFICKDVLSKESNMEVQDIKTFVFFDSETTGLPYQEHNKTRITELCFAAVQTDHISVGVFPRVLPKINLCFNPRKFIQPEATNASGLTNDLLENQPEFNVTTAGLLHDFLSMQRKPICLVAHNGNRFDYPILKAELNKAGKELPDDILCIDSLTAFRHLYKEDAEKKLNETTNLADDVPVEFQNGYDEMLYNVLEDLKNDTNDASPIKCTQIPLTIEEIQKRNETTPQKQIIKNKRNNSSGVAKRLKLEGRISFKLTDLYELLTEKAPTDAHKAEYDVVMLIECVAKLGQRFVDWANLNSLKFCNIPMMRPGKYIGT